jgi:hypothetical protein
LRVDAARLTPLADFCRYSSPIILAHRSLGLDSEPFLNFGLQFQPQGRFLAGMAID